MKNKIKIHAVALFLSGIIIQIYQVFWGNSIIELTLGFLIILLSVANFYTLDLLNFGTILKASTTVKFAFIRKYRYFNWLLLTIVFLLYFFHLNLFELGNKGWNEAFFPTFGMLTIFYGLTFMVHQNVQFLRTKFGVN